MKINPFSPFQMYISHYSGDYFFKNRHVAPLGHIILIPSHPVFAFSP
ncbi:hypothetical protein [uncultured Gammaproteobacteria bacterium]|nr:hypothetical protein [uncultured Gammaproteobacteria bacterium]